MELRPCVQFRTSLPSVGMGNALLQWDGRALRRSQTNPSQILKGAPCMRNKQKGFSLIELLIVVAIILIIAAIAIPNLLRSKMAANEASAVASLRTYNTSIVAYSTTYNTDPATNLAQLGPATTPSSAAADLVDNLLGIAAPVKSGYTFTYAPGTAATNGSISTYTIIAIAS